MPTKQRRDAETSVVPILSVRREFEYHDVQCSREQFPISLAYAITIHKSQGLTLDQAVLDFRHKEFASGQTYVGVSRVKKLRGLLFETPFDLDYFSRTRSDVCIMRAEDLERRRLQLL